MLIILVKVLTTLIRSHDPPSGKHDSSAIEITGPLNPKL